MQTILVPTDYTDTEIPTIEYAIHFAKLSGASKIILFHAVDNFFESDIDATTIELEWEFYNHVIKERQAGLNDFRDRFLQQAGAIQLETQCETVRIRDAVNNICADYKVDLVITGRSHNDELAESLYGSNIIALAAECKYPLIIVPAEAALQPLNEILFACDFNNPGDISFLPTLENLLAVFHPKIYALHVEANAGNTQTAAPENKPLASLLTYYKAEYNNLPSEDFRTAINEFVSNKKIDLIITIPKKHGLFEGLFKKNYTKELAFHTHVPLMILH